ncbi:hypothetical protein [uncultured Roseobacter sp.]|uniref:hypothetical protein n=1 Tax=uncultured Roseobacter sp. TaxID=114847 RepID=UPI00263881F0|nr:hypothetical protein [uncultured Roseobacter sp.]
MNAELARNRRLEALSKRKADRVLVQPRRYASEMNPPEEGTISAWLIGALIHGVTSQEIEEKTGWSRSTALVNLYQVAKRAGVGIRRQSEKLHIILPEGAERSSSKARVVNPDRKAGNIRMLHESERVVAV